MGSDFSPARMLEGDCAAALQLTVAGRAPVPSLRSGQASQRQVREAVPSRKTSALAHCVNRNDIVGFSS